MRRHQAHAGMHHFLFRALATPHNLAIQAKGGTVTPMRSFQKALIPLALLVCGTAQAAPMYGPYVGVSGTLGFPDYTEADRPKGYQAFVGYQFANPLFVEASYLDTGKANIAAYPGASEETSLEYKGASYGIGLAQVFWDEQVRLWVLGSYYDGKSKLDYPAGSIPGQPLRSERLKENASGGSLAFGGDFNLTSYFGLRVRIERMFEVKDNASDQDLMLVSVGAYFAFPVHDRSSTYVNPVRAVPVHEGPVSPDLIGGGSCSDGPATLAGSQPLRNQPKQESPVAGALPAGAKVDVIDSLGSWCLVRHEASTGWVAASAVQPGR